MRTQPFANLMRASHVLCAHINQRCVPVSTRQLSAVAAAAADLNSRIGVLTPTADGFGGAALQYSLAQLAAAGQAGIAPAAARLAAGKITAQQFTGSYSGKGLSAVVSGIKLPSST
jgi:hypothetical protein